MTAPTNACDALAVLRTLAACYEAERQSADGWRAVDAVADITEERDALRELLAADIALDELRSMPAQPEPVPDFEMRLKEAWGRRDATIARCKGGA